MIENLLENMIEKIIEDYFRTYEIEPINVRYLITEDMSKSYLENCSVYAQKDVRDIQNINQYNGIIVPNEDYKEKFTILLNKKYVEDCIKNNVPNLVGTIVHELTHIIDYLKYASMIKETSFENIFSIDKNAMFQLWSEFNAKVKGYYFVRKYSFENMFDYSQIEGIVDRELPYQYNFLEEKWNSTDDGIQQAYYLVHYIGRLYALQLIFPEYFKDEMIKELLPDYEWVYEWYLFLKCNDKLENVYIRFEEMKDILRKWFIGL